MVRRCFLLVIIALLCCNGALAGEKNQITNLFEGDSLAILNEEQIKTLDFVVTLICENDSIVILPQEINLLIGDTTKINYLSYPDWQLAYFQNDNKKKRLVVPAYAETPLGIVKSQIIVEQKKSDKYKCFIETQISTSVDESSFTGSYIESNIQGEFLKGKLYRKGVNVGEIEVEKYNAMVTVKQNQTKRMNFEFPSGLLLYKPKSLSDIEIKNLYEKKSQNYYK